MTYRDRIKELRRVCASELKQNPRNWRLHPREQQEAMRGVLAEVGFADAVLARELDDGSLELIDGHLRADVAPDQQIPVLVLDVSPSEADKILVTHDPLAALAETDSEQFDALLEQLDFHNADVQAMLDEVGKAADPSDEGEHDSDDENAVKDVPIPETFEVVIECEDEEDQRQVYQQMCDTGRRCRVITL